MPTNEEVASGFGWTVAMINSDPELRRLFNMAKEHNWTRQKFQAEFRDTQWFRRHGETWRRMSTMQKVDPGEWKKQLAATYASVKDQAAALGSDLDFKQLSLMAKHTLLFGYSDAELRDRLSRYVRFQNGRMVGQAGVNVQALRASALANGYTFNDKWYQGHVQAIARGDRSVEDVQTAIRTSAARAFPGFAQELQAGMDLADIASPYVNSMAQLLEINPAQINMLDPKIRSALSARDQKTGAAAPLSITDWERELRKDRRSRGTQWRQDASMSIVHGLLNKMGFVAA